MTEIFPVVLCGGSGTRLWPLSRKSFPKQFTPVVGKKTLFQDTVERMSGSTDAISFAAPTVLTNSDFRFIVTEQLEQSGISPHAVLIEPQGLNTGPAVLAAANYLAREHPDALMLVAPSDHIVRDIEAFHEAIAKGVNAVAGGRLVTFGIQPTHAETAYGYLELSTSPDGTATAIPLSRFVEKPAKEHAEEMLRKGNYMWNAGIFLFSVRDIIHAYEKSAPELMQPVSDAVNLAEKDLDFLRLDPDSWAQAEDISIDYAVMEHAENLSVVPFYGGWSDLGGWNAVWRESSPDDSGVVASDQASAIECTNTLLRSESDNVQIVGIGLKDVMAIATQDAVLVADMSRGQDVKDAVAVLKAKQVPQATEFSKDHRPWGWFESLVIGDRFQVKRILVHPGAALSLQSHVHRSEHWIVVEGTAKVTVGNDVKLVTENESVYVPLGAVHRMENPGKLPMVLIEVQTGSYVGEDDIVRYEDVYARSRHAASETIV
ncbi:mannose-1-phosphate guanylyltransferase/mannose-6-phosphate isomerase [Halocynthiibacter sp.]|uniref:mannose-1-phosphate guanylyltransferase/mannose-6-phosphate isomerase n=1 Tax=Halocynthiibacter sp. TaxID=1979210 RepID=UPI003C537361